MSKQKREKLKKLFLAWPNGLPMTTMELHKKGIDRNLLVRYKKSAWVDGLGRGAVVKKGDIPNWKGAVHALQFQLKLNIHVGGKTALGLYGKLHYIPMGSMSVLSLFGPPGARLPVWFRDYSWNVKPKLVQTTMFENKKGKNIGVIQIKEPYFLNVSSPERAILEVLFSISDEYDFDESQKMIDGLTNLRPVLVQALLEICKFVKVKRLFMYMAEKSGHKWLEDIDTSKIDFGSGPRLIVKNGKMNHKYQITVPKESEG